MPVAGKEQDPMNRWFRTVVTFVLVMVFATGAAAAGVIAGPVRVIDGEFVEPSQWRGAHAHAQ